MNQTNNILDFTTTKETIAQCLPRQALTDIMLEKYDVLPEIVDYAIDVLTAFFIEITKDLRKLIVMPQIPDWAWHEFILLSSQYSDFSKEVFGGYLPHMQITRDEDAFEESKRIFHERYGFDTTELIWEESGWNKKAYKFREKWRMNITEIEDNIKINNTDIDLFNESSDIDSSIDLSWLVQRVSERFAVNKEVATLSVAVYKKHLNVFKTDSIKTLDDMHCLGLWAWQEHLLWTERYKNDCVRLFGRYVHRPFISASKLFKNTEV